MDSHKLMLDVTHILLVKDEMKSARGIEGWHTTCLSKSWVKDDKEGSAHSQPVNHGIMELPGSSITHSLLVTLDVMWILVVMMCCSLSVGYGVRAISVPGKRWSGCSPTSCWTWDDKQLRLLKIGNCYLLPIIDETQFRLSAKNSLTLWWSFVELWHECQAKYHSLSIPCDEMWHSGLFLPEKSSSTHLLLIMGWNM